MKRTSLPLRRREFITLLGGAAAWPHAARAQQAKLPTIGFLGAPEASVWNRELTAFVQRLHELGWVEGRTVAIERRWGEGSSDRYGELAAEFVRLKVDVIVTGGAAAPAAKLATTVIPIVFAVASDPVAGGLVASLARPGGNVTGLSVQAPDLAGKRVELLRELLPGLRHLAIIGQADYRAAVIEMAEVEGAARTLGLDATRLEIYRIDDIASAIAPLKGYADALYVCAGPLVASNTLRISTLALGAHVPTIYPGRVYLGGGGLLSYGPSYPDLFRRAAEIVDKILHGARPSEIPVEQPTKFDFVGNLITAKALGLDVPPTLLAIADEVIE
jgi:putative tryptophan/tyrosine transport system substrate-binding protein